MKDHIYKLVASHTVLFALIVMAFLPEEQPYHDTSAISWGLYFAVVFVSFAFVIRSWIDYADYKRKQFRWRQFLSELDDWNDQWKWNEEWNLEWDTDSEEPPLGCVMPAPEWESEDDPFRDDNEPNQERNE